MTDSVYTIAALYHFAPLDALPERQSALRALMEQQDVRGTVLIASEGVNGTIAGSRQGVEAVLAWMRALPGFANLEHKESYSREAPFRRTKVRIKREIVSLGVEGVDPNRKVGTYVPPEQWNALIAQDDILLIDTRNTYETQVGTFEGAVDPGTRSFREFPDYVQQQLDPGTHRRVAMFCTGGIRCEKATSYLLDQGFDEVYHLQGGILNYLDKVPQDDSRWQGDCFVFDDRVTVTHDLAPGDFEMCHACRMPLSADERSDPRFVQGECCPHCCADRTDADRARYHERERQMALAAARGIEHLGPESPSAAREAALEH